MRDQPTKMLRDTFGIEPSGVTPPAQLFTGMPLGGSGAADRTILLPEMTGTPIGPEAFFQSMGDVIADTGDLS